MIASATSWRDNPSIWQVDAETYHADRTHVSSTALSTFIASRKLYHARYVAGTLPFPEPTESMRLGTALHARLLEPDRWEDLIAIAPDVDRRTKVGKAEWQNFVDGATGKTVITAEQAETVSRMVDGVMANPFAADLLGAAGVSELAMRWELDGAGVRVKVRFDRILEAGLVVDIKTTSDPSPEAFARTAYNFRYHCSAWLYRAGAIELGLKKPEFLHLAVGNEEPFDAVVYELDDRSLAIGEQLVRAALAGLRECRETGEWGSVDAKGQLMSGRINEISLPRWAF